MDTVWFGVKLGVGIVIGMVLGVVTGCDAKPKSEASPVTLLWMDDVGYPRSGNEFQNAFVLEPGCQGLAFRHWTGISDEERIKAMESPHWEVFYNGSDGTGSAFQVFAIRIEPSGFSGPSLSVGVKNAADAAQKACFVSKGKGGR